MNSQYSQWLRQLTRTATGTTRRRFLTGTMAGMLGGVLAAGHRSADAVEVCTAPTSLNQCLGCCDLAETRSQKGQCRGQCHTQFKRRDSQL